ncbi:MAG: RHS repeat-associated core domain-containing protein, partial [Planctomycetales bacterium]|nr:RHS repeat-associated core domain-containing protein [Planctomycetales bacterium]
VSGQQYSINALTDSSGTIKEHYAYDAYGGLSIFDGSGISRSATAEGNRYTYTGREWDEELGLYHYRARMYDAISGRFCSRDPIGFIDGHNLYQCNFVLSSADPYGTKTTELLVTSKWLSREDCDNPKTHILYTFSLKAWPCRSKLGFFIQEVNFNCRVSSCDEKKPERPGENHRYWEGWPIVRNRGKFPPALDNGLIGPPPKTRGKVSANRIVKFFCVSPDNIRQPGEILQSEMHRELPQRAETPCGVTSGSLPATNDEPAYWSREGAAGPAFTSLRKSWNCCDCIKRQKFVSRSIRSKAL